MVMWFLSFILFIWCITLIYLWILHHSCVPGINLTCSWCMILFICCWIWLGKIFLRIFTSILIRDMSCNFLLVVCLSWYQGIGRWPCRMNLFHLFQLFWIVYKNQYYVWGFLITNSFYYQCLVYSVCFFLIQSWKIVCL